MSISTKALAQVPDFQIKDDGPMPMGMGYMVCPGGCLKIDTKEQWWKNPGYLLYIGNALSII